MIGALVVTRMTLRGPTKRMWLLPRVISGFTAPFAINGLIRTVMIGRPETGRMRRMMTGGRNMRPKRRKRGQ